MNPDNIKGELLKVMRESWVSLLVFWNNLS